MKEGKDYKIIREPHYSKLIVYDGVTEIPDNQFEFYFFNEIILPNSLKRIGKNAFNSNNALKSIVIPDSVEYIGAYAFYGCINLEYVVLPKSITSINSGTFEYTKLKTIKIPDSVKVIADNSFYILSSDTDVTINLPPSIEMLGSLAFKNTEWNIKLNNGIKYVGTNSVGKKEYDAFMKELENNGIHSFQPTDGVLVNLNTKKNNESNKSPLVADKSHSNNYKLSRNGELVINDNIVVVGDFQGLNVKKVFLPRSVKYILPNAFLKNNIEQVNFSNSIIYIGSHAFEDSNFIDKNIVCDDSLILIENEAFPSNVTLNISDICSCSHNSVVVRKSKKKTYIFNEQKSVVADVAEETDSLSNIENILSKDESILEYYGYQKNLIETNINSIRRLDINSANEKGKELFDLIKNNMIDDTRIEMFTDYIVSGASLYYYDYELDVSLFELLVRKNFAALVSTLFNYGYSFDETDDQFIKIFFLSAAMDNPNILELLLILGVNPNITDKNRDTALNMAIKAKKIKNIKILLERGAAIGITNYEDKNAVDLGRQTKDINVIELLERENININGIEKTEDSEITDDSIQANVQADLLMLNRLLSKGGNR